MDQLIQVSGKITKCMAMAFLLGPMESFQKVHGKKVIMLSRIKYFPENSKEGFKTEALPTIWENKDEFNNLMTKSSNDMIKLTKIIDTSDDIRGTLGKMMWANCKACHSKFRASH